MITSLWSTVNSHSTSDKFLSITLTFNDPPKGSFNINGEQECEKIPQDYKIKTSMGEQGRDDPKILTLYPKAKM